MSRRLVRRIRNISAAPAEIKIKGATSNDRFGPTTQELNEISKLTFSPKSLTPITTVLAKRLNDQARHWRHVLKCLTVVEYCLLSGSNEFVSWMKSNIYSVSTLQDFRMKDNEEIAHQIRSKSRTITKLLKDDALLEEKRSNFHMFRSNMARPSIDKRSSLDIQRGDVETEEIVMLPVDVQRRATSLDIQRPYQRERDIHERPLSPVLRQEVFKMLDEIREE